MPFVEYAPHPAAQRHSLLLTSEVCRVVRVARSFICRNLGIRAERPRAIGLAVRHVRRDDLFGSFSFFHPLLERADRVETAGSVPSRAMIHARHHEQTIA